MNLLPAGLLDLGNKPFSSVVLVNTEYPGLTSSLSSSLILDVDLVRNVAQICKAVVGIVTISVVDLMDRI